MKLKLFFSMILALLAAANCANVSSNIGKSGSKTEAFKAQILSALPSNKLEAGNLSKLDFSPLWLDKRTCYLGFLGDDYQRLEISFEKVKKVSDFVYNADGDIVSAFGYRNFHGVIAIEDFYELKTKHFGVNNAEKERVANQGFVVASFTLNENDLMKESGIFEGILLTKWYTDKADGLFYDDIEDYADDYSNNQFWGTWINYQTNATKTFGFGQYRAPNSGDLDIGEKEFGANPLYIENGWQNYPYCQNSQSGSDKEALSESVIEIGKYRAKESKCTIIFDIKEDRRYTITQNGDRISSGVYEPYTQNGEIYAKFGEIDAQYYDDTILVQNYIEGEQIHFDLCKAQFIYAIKKQ